MINTLTDLFTTLGSTRYRTDRHFYVHDGAGLVSDVAVDAMNNVHVLIRHDPAVEDRGAAIVTLTPDGVPVHGWGGDLIADGHMLRAAPDGRLYVVDRDCHEVVVCTDLRRDGGLGNRHQPLKPFNHPTAVAFCPEGSIYVSDGYANHKVHRFSPAGELLASWGEFGAGPGQFMTPHDLWVMPDGRVVVVDRDNNRLQLFTPDGRHIAIWNGFFKPMGVWGDAHGNLFVTDQVPSLTLLASDGTRIGRSRPVLNGAHGICGDGAGTLYLAEPSPSRVTRLTPVSEENGYA